jgi:hypothetical protein
MLPCLPLVDAFLKSIIGSFSLLFQNTEMAISRLYITAAIMTTLIFFHLQCTMAILMICNFELIVTLFC